MVSAPPHIKICGITDDTALHAAVSAGAHYLGFVFVPDSPRYLRQDQAQTLSNKTPSNLINVGLFANATTGFIEDVLDAADLDMIQLHGEETPQQVRSIKGQFGLPVIKAVRIATKEDLTDLHDYENAADWLLCDAKSSTARGGTGATFDWHLLHNITFTKPWMLAGGLYSGNIDAALKQLKPDAVDISSGVERAPGVKDPAKIKECIAAVRQSL